MIGRKRRTGLRAGVGVGVAAMSVLVACGGGAAGGGGAAAGEPVRGGTLAVATPNDTGCIDPAQNSSQVIVSATRSFVDSLTYQDPTTAEIKPWLAESWTVNDTGTTYRFTLRQGVTFSDGSPLTAAVVKANLDAIVAMGAAAVQVGPYLRGMTAATVVDDRTVEVAFDKPNAQFLQATSTAVMGIVAGSSAAMDPKQRCLGTGLYGTAAFEIESYKPGQGLVVVRRDGYRWAPPGVANQGDAYLDRIEFTLVTDSSVRTGSLVGGQIDMNADAQTQDMAQLEAVDATISAERAAPGTAGLLQINRKRLTDAASPLSDVAVRRAVVTGVDRAALATTFVGNDGAKYYRPSTSILTPATPFYQDLSADLAYDRQGAAAMLDAAGWVPGPDGVRVKDGVRLSIEQIYYSPVYNFTVPMLQLAQQQLAEIGVELRLQPIPAAEGQQRVAAGDYDFNINSRVRADVDVLSFLTGYSPELDVQLAAMQGATDPAVRGRAADTAQRIVVEQALAVPIFDYTAPAAVGSNVQGFVRDASNQWQFNSTWKADVR